MNSLSLTIFSVLMVVCLATAASVNKFAGLTQQEKDDIKDILDLVDHLSTADKRGRICRDRYMDILSLSSSSFCRRRRSTEFVDEQE